MSWRLEWVPRAIKDLSKLSKPDRQLCRDRARRYADGDAEVAYGNVKRIGNELRLRAGDWRLFFELDRKKETVVILRVENRKDAYR